MIKKKKKKIYLSHSPNQVGMENSGQYYLADCLLPPMVIPTDRAALLLAATVTKGRYASSAPPPRSLRSQPAPGSYRAPETSFQDVCKTCQSYSSRANLPLPPVTGCWLSTSVSSLLLCHGTGRGLTVSSFGLSGATHRALLRQQARNQANNPNSSVLILSFFFKADR